MKKIVLSLLFFIPNLFSAPDEFIIKKDDQTKINKMSSNTLKEHIGTVAKKSLDGAIELGQQLGVLHVACSSMSDSGKHLEKDLSKKLQLSCELHRHAGQLQQHVARVQKKLSAALEKLIDDQKPFKKAGKIDLRATYVLLEDVQKELNVYRDQVVKLQQQLENLTISDDASLILGKKICNEVIQIAENCSSLNGKLLKDTCLKNV